MITSTQNRTIKKIRKLSSRRGRKKSGKCLIEGIQQVLSALENGAAVQMIVICPDLLTSEIAYDRVQKSQERGVRILRVSEEVFNSISRRDNPVGIAAVAEIQYQNPEQLELQEQSVITALMGINDPGNLGTIIRTVDATGGAGIVLLGNTTDPFAPRAIKASVGTVFSVPLIQFGETDDFMQFIRTKGLFLITTSAHAPQDITQVRFDYPCAILLGDEYQGLPVDLLEYGDLQVRIPICGQASSLNLAVAAGIFLYEANRFQ